MNSETTNEEKVKSTFESDAKQFDRIYEPTEEKSFLSQWTDKIFRKSMYIRFEQTLSNLNSDELQTILDIGCGSGRYCIEYLRMGKKVVGIDMSSNMLEIAKKSCSEAFPAGELEFINGDYMKHSFDDKFDVAVLMGLFDYIEDPESFLKKLQTDIKKTILGSFPKSNNFLNQIRKLRYIFKNCPLYFYSRKQLEGIFKSMGVKDYQIYETDREYYVKLNL